MRRAMSEMNEGRGVRRRGAPARCLWLLACGCAAGICGAQPLGEPAPERVVWRKAPVAVELAVGAERLVHFPGPVKVGVPGPLQDALRVQNVSGTVYLLAHASFGPARAVVERLDGGAVYLLDLSARETAVAPGALEIADAGPGSPNSLVPGSNGEPASAGNGTHAYGYVRLTRFAAQQLHAPARLLSGLPGVVRVPVERDPVALVRGGAVEAAPLVAWRAGGLYVTAVLLRNTTAEPQTLDPRALRGRWLAATFQHHRLHAAGSEADRTAAYLVSARPFSASLR